MTINLNVSPPAYIVTAYITDAVSSAVNSTSNLSDYTAVGTAFTNDASLGGLPQDDGSGSGNSLGRKIALGFFFGLSILTAICGNLLVVTAVFTERRLKRIKNNYFIVSLAVADLFVSSVVMTFAMANDIQQEWMFGDVFCRIWISFDIMCSTASILNLCVISLDRYIHIRNPMYYDGWMTKRKALLFIAAVWFLSALISFLPINLGWHENGNSDADSSEGASLLSNASVIMDVSTPIVTTSHINGGNGSSIINYVERQGSGAGDGGSDGVNLCVIELNFIYAIVSSTISFYSPCLIMLILYFRLFLFARSHAASIRSMKRPNVTSDLSPANSTPDRRGKALGHSSNGGSARSSIRASDHKAAFTLGVITGVFLCCWLPFFIINPIAAYNPALIHPNAFVVSTWLGYVNSCLNPVIYSIFNTEFREAFKRILCVRILRRDSRNYTPGGSYYSNNSVTTKIKKSEYAPPPSHIDNGNGTLVRKTSRDRLFNEKTTKL